MVGFESRGMMVRHGERLRESGDARAEVLEDGEGKLMVLAMRDAVTPCEGLPCDGLIRLRRVLCWASERMEVGSAEAQPAEGRSEEGELRTSR